MKTAGTQRETIKEVGSLFQWLGQVFNHGSLLFGSLVNRIQQFDNNHNNSLILINDQKKLNFNWFID